MVPRLLAGHLQRLATQYPVVTVTGPRQSGKTTLCKSVFRQMQYANLEDLATRQFAIEDPHGFLKQFPQAVILDEIQRAPDLPAYIQTVVDENAEVGQFILTGSQQFEVINNISQSLAGRTALLRLLPFAYQEIYSEKTRKNINEILYTGFFPRIHDMQLNPTEALSFYSHTYVERDLRSLVHLRDLSTFNRFLKLCASQIGQLTNYSMLANDCGIDQKTVKAWLSILKASYILYEIHPHFKNFRKRLTKASKLYFYDVGLAVYLLGITNSEQVANHPLRGALFENFVVTEFIKNSYNNVRDSNLFFFRDHVGNEVDLILDYSDKCVSVEIKSSQTLSSYGFRGLFNYQKISGQYNVASYLIYAGNEGYKREGVQVFTYKHFPEIFQSLEELG